MAKNTKKPKQACSAAEQKVPATHPVAKGKGPATKKPPTCYVPKSISEAKGFLLDENFKGKDYLTIALRCNQVCGEFLKGIRAASKQTNPFGEKFNLSERFCYLMVASSSVKVYHKSREVLCVKEYSPQKDQTLQELYESVLNDLAA